jgi:hypothetical protein
LPLTKSVRVTLRTSGTYADSRTDKPRTSIIFHE